MVDHPPTYMPDTAFYEMVVRYLDDQLDAEEIIRLEARLVDDENSRGVLRDVCLQVALIAESPSEWLHCEAIDTQVIDNFTEMREETADNLKGEKSPVLEIPSSNSPALSFLSNTPHGAFGYLSSGWPVAYLIATVIFGIGALIGSFTYVTHHVQVAERLPNVTINRMVPEPQKELVGRITSVVDCQWADSSTAPVSGLVAMGHKFAISSGLMEITYDTGAKVVLQGPVTYEVESARGGYLSLGKLTARVMKGPGAGEQGSERLNPVSGTSNPQSTIHNHLFAIRTPSAIVTDLGTEFGVEVDKHGGTKSHVFRGSVKLEVVSTDGASEVPPCILHANESAQVRKNNDGKGTAIYPVKVDPAVFVRSEQLPQVLAERSLKPFRRWQAFSKELRKDPSLLAYYDFQQAPGSPAVLRNVAANGQSSLDGVIKNATWSDGRMAGKQSLQFNGRDNCVRVNLPQKVDDLTLATWIYVESLDNQFNGLLMSESWTYPPAGQLHWQLTSSGAGGAVMLDVFGWQVPNFKSKPLFDASRFNLFRWKHLALVYDHTATCVRFYLNGQLEEEAKVPKHIPICIGPAFIGYWEVDYASGRDFRNFGGRIDELAIFGRALTYDQVQQIYEAGKL